MKRLVLLAVLLAMVGCATSPLSRDEYRPLTDRNIEAVIEAVDHGLLSEERANSIFERDMRGELASDHWARFLSDGSTYSK